MNTPSAIPDMKHFGTDGIRGKVGVAPISADFFLKLGWAAGKVLSKKPNASVIIGKDTRLSGYMFESALEAGFLSAGTDVILLGPMPTPAVAYLTQTYSATAGVVISASHNAYEDNGIKFFSHQGYKLSEAVQQSIEKKLQQQTIQTVPTKKIGKARRANEAVGRYIEFCKSTFSKQFKLTGLKIIIDCANGATYHIAPYVFRELGAEVIPINDKPDGFNINYQCGSTYVKDLKLAVIKHKADLGIAFDGDGDRLALVDDNGEIVDGDELLFIIAKYWQENNLLSHNAVVGTTMSNLGMRKSLSKLGIKFYEADVGDRYVMAMMRKHRLILGGESSGHIVCLNHATTGDGIISALQVLEALIANQASLAEAKKQMRKYEHYLLNIPFVNNYDEICATAQFKACLKDIKQTLNTDGKVLIRPSGTEPLIRISVEGLDATYVRKSAEQLAKFFK